MKSQMLKRHCQSFMFLAALLPVCLELIGHHTASAEIKENTYIVLMDTSHSSSRFEEDHLGWYDSTLQSVSETGGSKKLIMYAYKNAISGFATRLTSREAMALRQRPEVLGVQLETKYDLHTTRTPLFLGIDKSTYFSVAPPTNLKMSDVVIGVLDTGVWPKSASFNDTEFGPVPKTWNGTCETGRDFNCNKKLIGAMSFHKGYKAALATTNQPMEELMSPRDFDGHGTHTASTAAGSLVYGASLFDFAAGTARGMAPKARLAVYKVCWLEGCFDSDVLAGMEQAIQDKVNILSLSIGGAMKSYDKDVIATGAFAAMERGIFVSCSAGNSGPAYFTVSNLAPWITTVGAGTLDRDFPASVSLGNGETFTGASLYNGPSLPKKMLPFIYGGNATISIKNSTAGTLCMEGSLDAKKVAGKIVLCDRGGNSRVAKGAAVKKAGGIGMVLANTAENGEELVADAHLVAATAVGEKDGDKIRNYLMSNSNNATATIAIEGTKVGIEVKEPFPVVAAFSSRGPNPLTPQILKPDIIAPGVNILAGWTGSVGPTGLQDDTRKTDFNIISGTSMSCPHVSGLAAVLKGVHPTWSPAAIRSALMTTAYSNYKSGRPLIDAATRKAATPFDFGAGHVEPASAIDPGLVYDIDVKDYLDFLCASGYTQSQIITLIKRNFNCPPGKKFSVTDLNYPSFAVWYNRTTGKGGGSYTRTLTNVAAEPGTYNYKVPVKVDNSSLVNVSVQPDTLLFSQINEKKTYKVTFSASANGYPDTGIMSGRLAWTAGKYIVGSPLAILWTT
ncbi:unnamed protein product [Cuscuta europaea]|uniref:Subtilisin-like protease SBT1.7 n=1 Tax=Cuscuta europaea TaxID=41803 RepID=A0A9P0Z8U6_CUSEU|nr:unnamed protein product [Cuscuta europaea]